MSNFFSEVTTDLSGLESKLLGPDYKYFNFINTPEQMGMSADGSIGAIESDIAGLIAYVELLVEGGGEASQVPGPLGDKFFLETGAKCKDIATNKLVTRSLYINNVPDGNIPFISSGMGVNFTTFEGLVPGVMGNLANLNPMKIFQAFMIGSEPQCQSITMPTIDANNNPGSQSAYVINADIAAMNPGWFPNNTNPITGATRREAFSKAKFPEDPFIKIYYSMLGLLLLYIFLKMFRRKSN